MKTLLKVLAIACMAAPAAFSSHAQYPSKVVRIVSPYPTGISPDISARLVAEKLSRYWGQQVIVDPRPGANGFTAFGAVKKAPADGHELQLVGNAFMTINPALIKGLPYDAENDYVPLSLISRSPFFIWVATDSPYRTVKDMVAAAKADPKKIIYSTPYVGSPPHLGGAMLAQMTGTQMLAVHFKEGPAMFTSIVNGDVTFNVSTIGSATPLLKAGRLRALASASAQRDPNMPDVPTVPEAGGPAGYEVEVWVGFVAPRGTPADIVNKLSTDIGRALAEPDVREKYKGLGIIPVATTSAEMANLIRTDLKKNAELVQRIGIKPE